MSNSLIPSQDEITTYERYAKLQATGFFPKAIDNPMKAMLIMLKGRELGIPPLQAIEDLAVVDNKVTQSGKLMLARIYQRHPNADIRIIESTALSAVLHAARRKGEPLAPFSFSIEEAKVAGLLMGRNGPKTNWQGYAADMLYWRAVSRMAKRLFPDTLMGVYYTPEELGAETTEDGEVMDLTAAPIAAALEAKTNNDRFEPAKAPDRSGQGAHDGPAPIDTGRDDSGGDHPPAHGASDPGTKGSPVEAAPASSGPEPTSLSPVYNGKGAPEKRLFREMAFKFGIVSKEDLQKVSKECIGLQMDAIPARINELLEMGDFGL